MSVWAGTLGAVLLLLTALVHAWAGERMLIAPLLRRRRDRILEAPLARAVLRFAWHLTSVLMVMLAVLLLLALHAPAGLERRVIWVIGVGFTAIGLADLVLSRGRHIGWPLLLGAGVATLLAL